MSNPSGLTAREPALVASAAGAIVAYVLGLLVTHGVLTATQASAVTQQVAPMVASLLVMGLGALIRTRVTPVVKAPAPELPDVKPAPLAVTYGAFSQGSPPPLVTGQPQPAPAVPVSPPTVPPTP